MCAFNQRRLRGGASVAELRCCWLLRSHGAGSSEEPLAERRVRHQVSAGGQLVEDRVDLRAVSSEEVLVGERKDSGGQNLTIPSGVGAQSGVGQAQS